MIKKDGRRSDKREVYLTRMTGAIFAVFTISYFPCTITSAIDWQRPLSKHFHMFCALTVYIGSAINPILYGLLNPTFKRAYRNILSRNPRNDTKTDKAPLTTFQERG